MISRITSPRCSSTLPILTVPMLQQPFFSLLLATDSVALQHKWVKAAFLVVAQMPTSALSTKHLSLLTCVELVLPQLTNVLFQLSRNTIKFLDPSLIVTECVVAKASLMLTAIVACRPISNLLATNVFVPRL